MAPTGEQVQVERRADWRDWLENHHHQPDGVWLVTFKKHCGDRYVSYNDVVEEALCFGWVDSLPRKLDDDRTMLWMAPRKAGSGWSKANKDRVAKLTAAGLMAAAGLAKVEAAQQDGSWATLDAIEALTIPLDLATALGEFDQATQHFEAFPRSVKRGILEWIASAKQPETRAKRIHETAQLAQENRRANQWRQQG